MKQFSNFPHLALKFVVRKDNLINKKICHYFVDLNENSICCLYVLTDGLDHWISKKLKFLTPVKFCVCLCCLCLGLGFSNENSLMFRQNEGDTLQLLQITRARKNGLIYIHNLFIFEGSNLHNQWCNSLL